MPEEVVAPSPESTPATPATNASLGASIMAGVDVHDAGKDNPITPDTDVQTGYEVPWLKELDGGKHLTGEAAIQAFKESRQQVTTMGDELAGMKKRLGGFTGAPVNEDGSVAPYDFSLPEELSDVAEALGEDAKIFADAKDWGRKYGVSQDAMSELIGKVYAPNMLTEGIESRESVQAEMVEHFGGAENMAVKVKELTLEAQRLVGAKPTAAPGDLASETNPEMLDLAMAFSVPAAIRTIERLVMAANVNTLPPAGEAGDGGRAQYDADRKAQHMNFDPEREARIVAYAEKKGGEIFGNG